MSVVTYRLHCSMSHAVSSWQVEENTRENESSVDIQGGE